MRLFRFAIALVVTTALAATLLQIVEPAPRSLAAGTYAETVGGNANTWTNYTNAGGTQGPTIPAFTTVQITCALTGFRVADGNTWWYQIASSPWNNLYYVSADAFYNNGATSGSLHGTPFVDPAVPTCASLAGGTPETTGGAANTWTNYTNAGGTQGPTIAGFTAVQVECALIGFRVADGNTWWYRIASPPWNHAYYVSADAFYNNGATNGSLHGTPFVDPAVPLCSPGGGGGGSTGRGETTGGAANTWTNYTNAGGTQGPTIPALATVQIACKVTGFRVADGNTWWYQIASAPWSNSYYVSADAFYNNGAANGSLVGTPFVDPTVPDCASGARPSGETTGGAANTWANYTHAGGTQGPTIPAFTTVQVVCRVTGFAVGNGNTWWYLIGSSPWNSVYYASADAFYNNGATSGSLAGTPFVDPAVPVCVNNHEAPIYGTAVGSARGSSHAAVNSTGCTRADPINCASGDYWETRTDVSVPGRGPALNLTRTYNALNPTTTGLFGYGWSSTYDQHLTVNSDGSITATLADGSQFVATPDGSGGFTVPSWVNGTLAVNGDGTYTFTQRSTLKLTFTTSGQLISLRDLNGYQTNLAYDPAHHLTSVTDPAGRVLAVHVGANGSVSSVTDPLGRTTSYGYDASGNLTSVTDPLGRSWAYTYDSSNRMTSTTDPRGGIIHNTFDTQGRVTSQTDPTGHTTAFAYTGDNFSSLGGTTTVTDPRGAIEVQQYANGFLTKVIQASGTAVEATWTYAYDPTTYGATSVTDPNGHVTSRTYNAAGQVLTSIDPLGRRTAHTYNGLGQVLTTTTPFGEVTINTYDDSGNLLSVADPIGKVTTNTYGDVAHPGDITATTDPDHRRTTTTYDADGNVTSKTVSPGSGVFNTTTFRYDADGEQVCEVAPNATAAGVSCPAPDSPRAARTSTTAYDADGEVTAATDPNGHTTTNTYDGNGNRTKVTDSAGRSTISTFDADNRIIKVTDANGSTTSTAYDPNGNTVSVTDPNGHTTTSAVDLLNRQTASTNPLGQTSHYAYDPAGNRTGVTDPSGRTTLNTYDAANQITSVSYSDGVTHGVTYQYGLDGRRTSMTDGTGTTAYHYDGLGRLIASTNGAGRTVRHTYDGAGHPTTITYPNGKVVTNTYDNAGNLTAVTDWLGHKTTFAYDHDSNLTTQRAGSSKPVTDRLTYDGDDTVTAIASVSPKNKVIQGLSYTRNPDNLVASVTASGKATVPYTYDAASRLTKDGQGAYSYDPAGNLTRSLETAPMIYNAGDELKSAGRSAGTVTFAYDGQGNRTSTTRLAGSPTTYTYDQAGRLTRFHGATTATYTFNGDGLRMSKTAGSATTPFVWDTTTDTPLLLTDGTASYLYGPGGLPIESVDGSGVPTFFHHDQLGSTTMLTSDKGTRLTRLTYSSYGALRSGKAITPLLYAGQYRDAESGLYYLRARSYDPVTGQFMSVDPAGSITHAPYGYASNDPVNLLDPLGQWSVLGVIKTGLTVIGTGAAVLGAALAAPVLIGIGLVAGGLGGALALGDAVETCSRYGWSSNSCSAHSIAANIGILVSALPSMGSRGLQVAEELIKAGFGRLISPSWFGDSSHRGQVGPPSTRSAHSSC